jgi:hydroxypyruvate reductase
MQHPRALLLHCFSAALRAVDARDCVRKALQSESTAGDWYVLGVGKAAAAMAVGAHDVLGSRIARALVVVPSAHTPPDFTDTAAWQRIEAAHPLPDASSLAAGEAVLEFIATLPPRAPVLCLVSGGASSLLEVPRAGITLEDIRVVNRWALESGASIKTINAARRELSRVKGGGLAALLGEREALAFLISDVPGDDPRVIGSGLLHAPRRGTVPIELASLPRDVADVLERARRTGPTPLTRRFVETRLVATSSDACRAVAKAARDMGFDALFTGRRFAGDALQVAAMAVRHASRVADQTLHVQAGESVVRLPGNPGRGGRNQHLALGAAIELERLRRNDVWLLAAGTDGVDGNTNDAGALIDGGTCARGRDAGLDPSNSLDRADSGTFLEATGDLVHTGATMTNVGDLLLAVRWRGVAAAP